MGSLDAGMTISAIDSVVFHVVLMTKRNGLLGRYPNEGHPGAAIRDVGDAQRCAEQKDYDYDRNLSNCVRRRPKKLWHLSKPNCDYNYPRSESFRFSNNNSSLNVIGTISVLSRERHQIISRCKNQILNNFGLALALLAFGSSLPAANLDDATRELSRQIFQQLIEINTTDSVGNTTAAAHAMEKRLLDAGFPAQDLAVLGPTERKGNLVARLRGSGGNALKPILIICHLDVVEARREDWTTDPFHFVEKDGYFYGRGTQDMKESDAILVTTLVRLKREGYRPNRDIILALTADEEGGTANGVDWLLKNHRDLVDADFVLNPDGGGVITEHGKPVDIDLDAAEKLYADFQLTSRNPGGHSSLPVPDNAIYHIADALGRLQQNPFPFELNSVTRAYFEHMAGLEDQKTGDDMKAILRTPPDPNAMARLSADPRYNSTMRTTCVATRLSAGHANNALPQTAQALVNCRILPGHSREEVRQNLIRIFADPKIQVDYIDPATGQMVGHAPETKALSPPPLRPDVLKPLERIADEMWPGAPVVPEMETGASDSIYTKAAGMPSYGTNGIAIDRDDVRAHGKDERLRVSSYYDGVDFYYRYLKALTAPQ
jgi:acetylornithine deacetylase/succinyl-diaminopimelate desuccinylase-like protein